MITFAGWLAVFLLTWLFAVKFEWFGVLLNKHHLKLAMVAVACFAVFVLAGCGPLTWLTDATSILPIAGGMLIGILALVGKLTGSNIPADVATKVTAVITEALKGIQDVEAIINEYKQNPSTTLLASIQSGVKAVSDNISQFMVDTGITNEAAKKVVTEILSLFLTELTALQSMLPALNAKAGQYLSIQVPMTSKNSKAAYNAILSTPTGDADVDEVLGKLHRL